MVPPKVKFVYRFPRSPVDLYAIDARLNVGAEPTGNLRFHKMRKVQTSDLLMANSYQVTALSCLGSLKLAGIENPSIDSLSAGTFHERPLVLFDFTGSIYHPLLL